MKNYFLLLFYNVLNLNTSFNIYFPSIHLHIPIKNINSEGTVCHIYMDFTAVTRKANNKVLEMCQSIIFNLISE